VVSERDGLTAEGGPLNAAVFFMAAAAKTQG
jgi:hypothetical protein